MNIIKKRNILLTIVVLLLVSTTLYFYINQDSDNSTLKGVHIIDLKDGTKHLLFYGSKHSNNKTDPMFEDIKEMFFKMDPQRVLVEGHHNRISYNDVDIAIKNGESAYVSYLAQKNNISLGTVEPSISEQYNLLLEKYGKNKVLAMYTLRQLNQYQRQQKYEQMKYSRVLCRYVLGMVNRGFPLNRDKVNIDYIERIIDPYLDQKITKENWTQVNAYKPVYKKGHELNEIYEEIYTIRNKNLVSTIKESLKKYNRVFVIMGSQHVIDEKENIKNKFYKIINK